jgi:hypothetical protein
VLVLHARSIFAGAAGLTHRESLVVDLLLHFLLYVIASLTSGFP